MQVGAFGKAVGAGLHAAQGGAYLLENSLDAGVALRRPGRQSVPITYRGLASALVPGRSVCQSPGHVEFEPGAAFVAQGDALPAARLADNRQGRAILVANKLRAAAVAFLANRANDHQPAALHLASGVSGGGGKRSQRALCIDRAATIKGIAIMADRDEAGHGVNVPQQGYGLWPFAAFTDGVAGGVHPGMQSAGLHLPDEVLHRLDFLAGGAVD